ncbi:hypothetical protein [Atopomonas sediminilitoris]|uniref:hypothetical protein n=1 Tax=Atopomonas sediminilitoris TaxID=2919919 RepID=UPI001F4EAD3B|nr:hypothetical protein [Atopomonas sediminilitoris]MCJ8168876.1 hypothetical protein [Atopomonas sediminilitoris]
MLLQKTTFERLLPAAPSGTGLLTQTSFGFESNRKRHFDVTVPGSPKVEQGMTVIALLEIPNNWSSDSFLGCVNCADGSLACDSPGKLFGIALVNLYFSIMFPVRAYDVVATPSSADLIAFLIAILFAGFALRFFYLSAKAFLVKRTLVTVREFIKPTEKFAANTLIEKDASPQSGSRPSP